MRFMLQTLIRYLGGTSVVLIVVFSPVWFIVGILTLLAYNANLPSISVDSVSITVININSNTQLTANLEVNFVVKNNNIYNNNSYDNVNIIAYQIAMINNLRPIDTLILPPFEQQGEYYQTVQVRLDNVSVEVDKCDCHINGRQGTMHLFFEWMTSVRMKEGKWLKPISDMNVVCEILEVVFPWNQTQRFDFRQQNNACQAGGGWRILGGCISGVYWIVMCGMVVAFFLWPLLCS